MNENFLRKRYTQIRMKLLERKSNPLPELNGKKYKLGVVLSPAAMNLSTRSFFTDVGFFDINVALTREAAIKLKRLHNSVPRINVTYIYLKQKHNKHQTTH